MPDGARPGPRWFTDTEDDHSQRYVARFRRMAAEGADLTGEARFMDALVAPGSRILDAGCGPGRIGAELHARGHTVVGVDVDPVLIDAAEADHPGPRWLVADLAELDLGRLVDPQPTDPQPADPHPADPQPADPHPADSQPFDGQLFDAAVLAGNVMVFVAPGTERRVLERVAAHVRPGGAVVTGFALDRDYRLDAFDADCAAVGLELEHRFAGWDLAPWHDAADWAVTVLRRR